MSNTTANDDNGKRRLDGDEIAKRILIGAGASVLGSVIGSVLFPGVGTAIGAKIGAVLGGSHDGQI